MRTTRTSGLTLVEVLIALVVVMIAFGALAFSQVAGFRATRGSQDLARASDAASRVMEEIRADGYMTYAGCEPGSTVPPFSWARPCNGSGTVDEVPVAWSVTNEPVGLPVLDPPALVAVRVVATLPDGNRFPLYGYLSCGDPGDASLASDPCPAGSLR